MMTNARPRAASTIDDTVDYVYRKVSEHDPRNRWFGTGRTVLALAQLSILVFTAPAALMVPLIGQNDAPHCAGVQSASLYCLGHDVFPLVWRHWVMAAILLLVATGWRPRVTALPHAWIAYSIAGSIALPDGGESVVRIVCVLIVPLALLDDRGWHWQHPTTEPNRWFQPLSYACLLALRLQLAFIYFDSAISKFGVSDWVNGTAEYYFLRDNAFGASYPLEPMLIWISNIPALVISMTWGALVIELLIGILFLGTRRWRKVGLTLDIVLHFGIIATMGLWSFSTIMIGSAIIAAMPTLRRTTFSTDDTRPTLDVSDLDRDRNRRPDVGDPITATAGPPEAIGSDER